MRNRFSETLRASQSLRDLRIFVEAAAAIALTWLLLGWTFDRAITQADGSWLVVPYTDSLLDAGGDWTRHLYRFGVLGGSEMHAFGGTLPLVQLGAWLGLSTTTTVNLVTCFIQLAYGLFAIRLAEGMVQSWRDAPARTSAAQRVVAVWLVGFAPLLGNRLAVGHENLLLGFLPLFVVVSLIWQARAGRPSAFALVFAAFAIGNGVSGLGAQSLFYSAVFGLPVVAASLWGWPRPRWALVELALVSLTGVLLVLPRLVPMIVHALGPDATRGLGASVTTSYGVAPASDWLTSVGWTIGDRPAGSVHEHNYPLGPLAVLVAVAWPGRTSRRLLWVLLATLALAILFASDVPPVSTALHAALPMLDAFRGPSRGAMAALLFIPALALACWHAQPAATSEVPRLLAWIAPLAGAAVILSLRGAAPWVREVMAWLLVGALCYLMRTPRPASDLRARLAASTAFATVAAFGVLAFDERFPRAVAFEPIEHGPYQLRAAIAPEQRSALDRVVVPDAPPPYEMSTAFAARVSSIDGVWYPPPRFLALLSSLAGKPLPATTSVFRPSHSSYFPVLQQLYNVRFALRGLGGRDPVLQELPATPGPAWFPEDIVRIESTTDMIAALRGQDDLRAALARTAWVLRAEVPPDLPATCHGARVDRVTTDELGQSATFATVVPTACVLVVATNYATTLVARGLVAGREQPLQIVPIDVALTGIVAPSGTTLITLAPQGTNPWWSHAAMWLALLLLAALLARRMLRSRATKVASAIIAVAACSSRNEPPRPTSSPQASEATSAPEASRSVAPHTAGGDTKGANVLVIMIDTMRADRLGVAGYSRLGRSLTPNLDRFAATATRFTRAYAHAANTPRSFPSFATSRLPSQVAYHKTYHNFPAVLDENVLLFEVLRDAGLHTVSVSSHFYFEPRRNVTQGFIEYDNSGARDLVGGNADYAAPRIIPKAIARLEALAAERKRFAMFVHLFEPHSTYLEHPEFPVAARGEAGLVERYDYEIAIDDGWVGKLLDAVDNTQLTERTIVVILSDHGEAFGAHRAAGERAFFHGQTLYDEVLRVPLLMRIPGVAPSVREQVVGLIDVAPTILDALEVAAPAAFTGRSLLALARGESLAPRDVRAELPSTPEWNHSIDALITGDGAEKIIIGGPDRHVEVYNLRDDPDERTNVADRDAARLARLREALEAPAKPDGVR